MITSHSMNRGSACTSFTNSSPTVWMELHLWGTVKQAASYLDMLRFLFRCLIVGCLCASWCKVDLFVSNEEVKRVLGLNTTLPYVEDGLLNEYALKFQVPVPDAISQLFFQWVTRAKENVYYSIGAKLGKTDIMEAPSFSIPTQGIMPFQLEAFSVNLKCTGRKNGEVGVEIHVNYTWPSPRNVSNVVIRRKKICFHSPDAGGDTFPNGAKGWSDSGKATNVFYISIGGLFGLIVIIALLLVVYFTRLRKPTCGYEMQNAYRAPAVQEVLPPWNSHAQVPLFVPNEEKDVDFPCGHTASFLHANGSPTVPSSSANRSHCAKQVGQYTPAPVQKAQIQYWRAREVDIVATLQKLNVDSDQVELGKVLLEGNFGEVVSGLLEKNDGLSVDIIGKTVKKNASESQVTRFLRESLMFHGIPYHPNVSFVIAAFCLESSLPLLCYMHRGFGNLKKFLNRCSGVESALSHSLSTQDLVLMALHICRGLLHLHRNGIVHRDMATRNCLVCEDFVVQICDTGLSRDLFPQDYHCLGDNENRPVKWLALESLEKHEFSTASDVWSFGVTLWELVSLAHQPYHEVDPFEMAAFLMEDQRLYQPYNCPDELYGLMYCCWNLHPEARPSCPQLMVALEDFYNRLTLYI
uniref:receptor protein-tyrosine kinase n=1 Tax=Trichuris muris TaxID=70415 RepID=A0A5S6PZP7_TRIMR